MFCELHVSGTFAKLPPLWSKVVWPATPSSQSEGVAGQTRSIAGRYDKSSLSCMIHYVGQYRVCIIPDRATNHEEGLWKQYLDTRYRMQNKMQSFYLLIDCRNYSYNYVSVLLFTFRCMMLVILCPSILEVSIR